MANINFDDGFETFTINGDSNRVIKINPKDGNILIRFDEAMRDLKNESERLSSIKVKADGSPVEQAGISLEESTSRLGEFNQLINNKMDYIFNADVRQAAFGRRWLRQDGGRDARGHESRNGRQAGRRTCTDYAACAPAPQNVPGTVPGFSGYGRGDIAFFKIPP